MRIVDSFLAQCRSVPQAVALVEFRESDLGSETCAYTWDNLLQLVQATIEWLGQHVPVSDHRQTHIASWLPNSVEWVVLDLATQWLGWVHAALDTRLPWPTAIELARHAGASLCLVSESSRADGVTTLRIERFPARETLNALTQHSQRRLWDDRWVESSSGSADAHRDLPAQILYTSGTISRPKGVVLTHGNLLSNARGKLLAAPQVASDVRLNILPFAHAYARTCELSTWILSGSQLCLARDWSHFLQWAPELQPTLVNLVPHLAQKLVDRFRAESLSTQVMSKERAEALLGSKLRLLQVGGASLPRATWDCLAAVGWPPLQGYGLTETSPVLCSNIAGQQRPDTVGPPVKDVELRIDNENVLWTRGPQVMQGYWQDEAATRAKIIDGWLCTDDLAEWHSDGSLHVLGRTDDQIALSTGYKVLPLEIIRRLSSDPWLESLVIVGQNRPFLVGLVWPRIAELPIEFFHKSPGELPSRSVKSLDASQWLTALVQRWQTYLSDLPRAMRLEKLAMLPEPLTVDNGGLNFKGGQRRKFIEEHLCVAIIERIYADASD